MLRSIEEIMSEPLPKSRKQKKRLLKAIKKKSKSLRKQKPDADGAEIDLSIKLEQSRARMKDRKAQKTAIQNKHQSKLVMSELGSVVRSKRRKEAEQAKNKKLNATVFANEAKKVVQRRMLMKSAVSIRVVFYAEAKTVEEKSRTSAVDGPDDTRVYPFKEYRVNASGKDVSEYYGMTFNDDIERFKDLQLALIHNPLDPDDIIARGLDTYSSQLVALKIVNEGPAVPVEAHRSFEVVQPIKDSQAKHRICFPYLRNSGDLLKGDPMAEIKTEFVRENFKPMSCLASLILDMVKQSKKGGKKLTYERLWAECSPNAPPTPGQYALNLAQAVKYFKARRLSFIAVDIFQRVLMYYHPSQDGLKLSKCMYPGKLRVLVHQGHAYLLNHDLKKFDQKFTAEAVEAKKLLHLKPSKLFYIQERFGHEADVIVDQYKDVVTHMNKYDATEAKSKGFSRILSNCSIEGLLVYLRLKAGVVASSLQLSGNIVTGFCVEKGGHVFYVCNFPCNKGMFHTISDKEYYRVHMKWYESMYRKLINMNHKSYYHPQFLSMMDYYIRSPLKGKFGGATSFDNTKRSFYIDENKAYTKRIMELKFIPVYDEWCFFRKPNSDHTIDEHSIYFVRSPENVSSRNFLVFDRRFVLISGRTLMTTKLKCEIISFCTPAKLIPNTIASTIKQMYADPLLTKESRKMITNIMLGWTDKKFNSRSKCEYFDDVDEAYAKKMNIPNSSVYSLADCDSTGVQDDASGSKTRYYLLLVKEKVLMNEGFLPISFMKYDLQRLSLWQMYGELEGAGFDIRGCNTDCLYVDQDPAKYCSRHKKKFDFSSSFDSIGKWKFDSGFCPDNELVQQENDLLEEHLLRVKNVKKLTIECESRWREKQYNDQYVEEALELFSEEDTFIEADLPGSGKTTLIKKYVKGTNHVIVCPYNTLCMQAMKEGFTACTLSKLFGHGKDDERSSTSKPVDVSGVEIVVFDEIFLYRRRNLAKIKKFMEAHPTIRFLATGDPLQNPAIEGQYVNIGSRMLSASQIVDILFPTQQLRLCHMKRVRCEDEERVYRSIKQGLFAEGRRVKDVIASHKEAFGGCTKVISDVKTKMNISFLNATRQLVNNHVFGSVEGKKETTKGQKVVFKGYLKGKDLVRNGAYEVTKITANNVYLKSVSGLDDACYADKVVVTKQQFQLFELPYCYTCHAYQGLTCNDEFTLFDVSKGSREWFWTAITRATSLKKVYMFTGKSIARLPKVAELRRVVEKRIASHRQTDKKNGLFEADGYVTVDWVLDELKRVNWVCESNECRCELTLYGHHQFSIHRIDNNTGHTKANCKLICLSCNHKLG